LSDAGRMNTKYRDAARRVSKTWLNTEVRVSPFGGVYNTPEGAYVEVEVWIPKQAVDEPEK
jgi:hypothetical protein